MTEPYPEDKRLPDPIWDPPPPPCDPPIEDDPPRPDSKKASKGQIRNAGIANDEEFKSDWGGIPNQRIEICACKDGSIRIERTKKCGKSAADEYINTDLT